MANRSLQFVAHPGALAEDARKDEEQKDGEPSAGGETGVDPEGVRLSGYDSGDYADGEAKHLEPEQDPADGLQPRCIPDNEGIARADAFHDREQPPEEDQMQRDAEEAEDCDCPHAEEEPVVFRRRRVAGPTEGETENEKGTMTAP